MTPKKGFAKLVSVSMGLGPHCLRGSELGAQVKDPPDGGDNTCRCAHGWKAGARREGDGGADAVSLRRT